MKLFWNARWFSPQEFLKVSSSDAWVVEVQRVLSFLRYEEPYFSLSTSGSTGTPKRIEHPRERMLASAQITLEHFQLQPGDPALLALPAKFIGGAMMVVRAYVGDLDLYLTEPKLCPTLSRAYKFLPLTPAQYAALLEDPEQKRWLVQSTVLLGGGPVPAALEGAAEGRVAVGYGMTETVSHVALRSLGDPVYRAIGPVRFECSEEGALRINAPHLGIADLQTNDAVELISPGAFKFLGRTDFVINSGGVKIHPEQLEQFLEQQGIAGCIAPLANEKFGQVPVVVVFSELDRLLIERPGFWEGWPKYAVPRLGLLESEKPVGPSGKLDRNRLEIWVREGRDRLFPI